MQRAEKSQEDTTQAVERSNAEARKLQEKIAELEAKAKRQADNVRQLETENDKLQTKTRELQEWKKITQDEANKAVEQLVMLQHDMTKLQQEKAELERRVKDGVRIVGLLHSHRCRAQMAFCVWISRVRSQMDYEKVRDFYRKKSMLTLEQEDSEKKRAVDEGTLPCSCTCMRYFAFMLNANWSLALVVHRLFDTHRFLLFIVTVVHGDFDDDAQPDGTAVAAADLQDAGRKGSDTNEMKV